MEEKIIEAYKEMVIKGDSEINPFTLSQKVGLGEKDFFQYFSSVDDIGRKIWVNLCDAVMLELNQSELYSSYPSRQKILSYFFTFFEIARTERTFITRTVHNDRLVRAYAKKFKEVALDIIQEGIATEDIQERFYSSYYPDIVWNLHFSLLRYWVNDDSENFVETEKAIEIYSKVPLEIMGPNIFDSIFDSIKFSIKQINLAKIFNR
jgi:hypothetical protein